MHLVVAVRQFDPEFGCDYAAAAVSRVAGYSYSHGSPVNGTSRLDWQETSFDSEAADYRSWYEINSIPNLSSNWSVSGEVRAASSCSREARSRVRALASSASL